MIAFVKRHFLSRLPPSPLPRRRLCDPPASSNHWAKGGEKEGTAKNVRGGKFSRQTSGLSSFPLFSRSGGNERNDVAARMYWKWESLLRNRNFLPHGNMKIIYTVIFPISGQTPLPAPAAPPATRIVEISVSAAAAAEKAPLLGSEALGGEADAPAGSVGAAGAGAEGRAAADSGAVHHGGRGLLRGVAGAVSIQGQQPGQQR